jgi:hypothetical protein
VAIGALVAFMVSLRLEDSRNGSFKQNIDNIAFDTIALTQEYKSQEDQWIGKPYDNSTMGPVFDQYQARYQQLIDRANALDTPERYKVAKGHLVDALEFEMQSNLHFRNYLISGDEAEREKASELASQSLLSSADYDAAIKAAG